MLSLVHSSAVPAYLSRRTSEGADAAHLDHGAHEVAEEGAAAVAVGLHQSLGGRHPLVAREQPLVRRQQSLLAQQVLEVVVVEHVGGVAVERRGRVPVAAL